MTQAENLLGQSRSTLLESTLVARDRSINTLMDGVRSAGLMAELVKGLSAGQSYTVVFGEAAKGSLHQLEAGLYEAAVRDGSGHYIQRVLLKPAGGAIAGAIAGMAVQIAMADIASRLDQLQVSINRLRAEPRARQKGNVFGALGQLELIHHEREISRSLTLVTVRSTLNAEFAAGCINVKKQITILPDLHDASIFDFFAGAEEQTLAALAELRFETALALCCAEGLAQAEFHLIGAAAAAEVLDKLVADLRQLPLRDVQDKVRRISAVRGKEAPDRFWTDLEHALELVARDSERLKMDGLSAATVQVSGADLLRVANSERPAAE
jgi:hypothetical protein